MRDYKQSTILRSDEVSDDYIQEVLDLTSAIAKTCYPIFKDKSSNLIINAVNKLHSDLIFLITNGEPSRAMEAESLLANV